MIPDLTGAEVLADGPNRILRLGDTIVRLYRPTVTAERMADLQYVRTELRRRDVPVPALSDQTFVVEGRLAEVEKYVEHDGQMNTPSRLLTGMPMLGRLHTLLRELSVSPAGRTCDFANHIEASDALEGTRRGVRRMRGWGSAWNGLADRALALAELVAPRETEVSPRQLVHGDFWDDNVFFLGERLVAVADFDFLAERPRLDDLALTLYFSDSQFGLVDVADRIDALRPLVEAYDDVLDPPLSAAERLALPWAIARQPLWGFGHWVLTLDDAEAQGHAAATEQDLDRVIALARDPRWAEAFVTP